jgi:hypothetical protein
VIVGICTESFLSSSGFEYRKEVFSCLVNHLEEQNVTDEYFDVARSYNVSTSECAKVLNEFDVMKSMKSMFYSSYNVTLEWCEKSLCDKNETKTSDEIKEERKAEAHALCFQLSSLKAKNNETAKAMYSDGRERCDALAVCMNCIKENLKTFSDYERIKLHAVALNFTVIEFRVWNYFTISERVLALGNDANKMELEAVNKCKDKKQCNDNIEV